MKSSGNDVILRLKTAILVLEKVLSSSRLMSVALPNKQEIWVSLEVRAENNQVLSSELNTKSMCNRGTVHKVRR